MKRFKNILVVVSDQEMEQDNNPALQRASDLAERNQARLSVIDVVREPTQALKAYKNIISTEELTKLLVEDRKKLLAQVVAPLEDRGLEVDINVVVGRDFIEIVRQVLRGKHDILIKSANKHVRNFDSSDFHLMRKCPVPVWLMKPQKGQQNHNILAAVDVALEETSEGRELNRLIMDLSTSLARWENSSLDIVTCWSLYGENALRHSAFLKIPDTQLDTMLRQEQALCQQRLQNLMANYDGVAMSPHVIKGNPKTCIAEFVHKGNIDIVVMGTVGRTGIPGLLIGNTAETVLQSIDTSVITVKPNGFETPVKLDW